MSPRRDIAMTPEEIDAFLGSQSQVVVAGVPSQGAVQGAVGHLRYEGGRVGFSLRADDPVAGLLAHDDRACCVVEQFPSYYEIMGVLLHGRATRHEGDRDGLATFDLDVDKVVSFDFGKLAGD